MENTISDKNRISADVNAFPSLTWHHLHINHGHFEGNIDSEASFTASNLPENVEITKAPLEGNLLDEKIRTQMGEDFDEEIERTARENGIQANLISIKKGSHAEKTARITFNADSMKNQAAETVIVAGEGSASSFVFEYIGSGSGEGTFGHRIRALCAPGAKLSISTVNLLGKNMSCYNGIGAVQKENSSFSLIQVDLGAKNTVTGSYIVLEGYQAESSVKNGYLSKENQNIDINYVARHEGKETKSDATANGVMDGKSKKAWRGTIDFITGCTDASGDEQENVLLLNPETVNKSMPVILCGEESVDGRHGSTVGKLDENELLYLGTRGIDKETARTMMIKSRINAVSRCIDDESTKEKIEDFLKDAL